MVGAELAQRVPRRADDVEPRVPEHRPDGGAVGEERRLGVHRERELLGGAFPAEAREREAQGVVRLLEDGARGRERIRQILPHPDRLGALPRKEQGDAIARHQRRTTLAAHVKPAPKATISTSDPGPARPCSIASSSATGMEADDMLP